MKRIKDMTEQERIAHAKATRTSALHLRNMKTLAGFLAREYRLRVVSVSEDSCTLTRQALAKLEEK